MAAMEGSKCRQKEYPFYCFLCNITCLQQCPKTLETLPRGPAMLNSLDLPRKRPALKSSVLFTLASTTCSIYSGNGNTG